MLYYAKIILLCILIPYSPLNAKDYKLELGFGLGGLYYPNYIGSKSMQTILVPLPFIRYYSKYLNVDEDGLNQKLFGIDGLKTNLSISGSLPANSDDNGSRSGMPDLDLTGEIGIKFIYRIFNYHSTMLELEFPIRAVLSTNFNNVKYRGIISTPQFKYSLNYNEFEWTFRFGVIFGNKEYNNYYYGVPKKYETSSRVYYKANSGFNGYKSRIGMSYKKNFLWFGAFMSYYNISSAVFNDSPLVEINNNIYTGISVAYIFYTEK